MLNRRNFLRSALAAPLVVRSGLLMPIKALVAPVTTLVISYISSGGLGREDVLENFTDYDAGVARVRALQAEARPGFRVGDLVSIDLRAAQGSFYSGPIGTSRYQVLPGVETKPAPGRVLGGFRPGSDWVAA